MRTLILGEADVARLLPMDECGEVMAEALEALERGEMHQPLRFVVRPPDAAGLPRPHALPTARGPRPPSGSRRSASCRGTPARGLDAHQGVVILSDGETGEVRAVVNASAITAIRTAAVSAAATRLLAREGRASSPSSARACRPPHLAAMAVARDFEVARIWSRTPEHAEAAAAEAEAPFPVEVAPSAEDAVANADVVCTTTSAPEPIVRREWLRDGAHVNAVGSSIPTTRELDTATMAAASLFVDRRESTLNEAGDFLYPQREGAIAPEHIRAELGEPPGGARPGTGLGRRAHRLQVPRPRRRGPGRRGTRLPARARVGRGHRGRA